MRVFATGRRVESLQQAIELVKELLRRVYGEGVAFRVYPENFRRHAVISIERGDRIVDRVYLVFQREPFHKFCKYFPRARECPGAEAITLNWSIIHHHIGEAGIRRVIHVLGDGRIVTSTLIDWLTTPYCRKPMHEDAVTTCHLPIPRKSITLDIFTR